MLDIFSVMKYFIFTEKGGAYVSSLSFSRWYFFQAYDSCR